MSKYTSPLDEVRVAAPCPADWGKMVGDERVRFCGSCERNVYNLSGMTRREAEALVTSTEGRLCVRFFRRADGTILTRNCPVGLSAVKRRVARVAGSVLSAVVAFLAGLGLNFGLDRALSPSIMEESAVPAPRTSLPVTGQLALPVVQGEAALDTSEVRGMMAPVVGRIRRDDIVSRPPAHTPRQR
jgi:hypothetical protein